MVKTMGLAARKELVKSVRQKYCAADWNTKRIILEGFIAATDYDRKYATHLLCRPESDTKPRQRRSPRQYDDQVRQALITVWNVANQICSKRLVPFLPDLVDAMERHGHLRLPADVRMQLLSVSAATVDRLLSPERAQIRGSISTTRRGNLLKHQIPVRTFADWDDVVPGFLEADLVAHCGGNASGAFLNTLVLVDISTGWLECMPLLRKSAADVIDGLRVADDLLPFPIQGLDTDCGSEFINYDLLDYCEDRLITFTRARSYKKNDQAHVEEKNGSVVRRLVGYDRFEGRKAWEALARLYRVLRKYINFFQPSMKLLEKQRSGAKVSKKYDAAKTPYQRILMSGPINRATKESLRKEYQSLDPVDLLDQLEALQDKLWQYSGKKNVTPETVASADGICTLQSPEDEGNRYYHSSRRIASKRPPRTWRTRKDPFEQVWDEVRLRLELMPELIAKDLIGWLMVKYPNQFNMGQIRTMQRRTAEWRQEQLGQERRLRTLMTEEDSIRFQDYSLEVRELSQRIE